MRSLSETWQYREVLLQLSLREIRIRFKQSLLGIGWAVIQPVSLMFLFTIIFTRFLHVDSGPYPYALFVFCTLLPWLLFSNAVTRATSSLTNNSNLIQKIYIPRHTFVLMSFAPPLLEFVISLAVYAILMAWYRVTPTPHILWIVPLLLLEMLLVFGVGLWLSMLNAFYRDVGSALGLLLQLWFWATPVVYPLTSVPPWLIGYYRLNPTVGIVEGFRDALLVGKPPDPLLIGISLAWTLALVVSGNALFQKAQGYFADVL